jgi:hypothetical protein
MATRRKPFVAKLEVLEDRTVPALIAGTDGGTTVFDTNTGMMWLADANFAAEKSFGVKGINPDGSMSWETAMTWVAHMNKADYLGHDNWTLPFTPAYDPNATQFNPTGGLSYGFDCSASDMGELFYTEFGARAGDSISDVHDAATSLFTNLQAYYYWSGVRRGKPPLPADFSFGNGFLGTDRDIDFEYALPGYPAVEHKPPAPPKNNVQLILPTASNPTLVPNPGGQTVFDPALNINWLANADLAATQTFGVPGINADGSMNHRTALAWVAAMNAADYLGHDNWRLPTSNGSNQDQGYAQFDTEMGELYYSQLGGEAGSTIQLTHNALAGLFSNLQPYYYWSGTEVGTKPNTHQSFSFGSGFRSGNTDPNEMYVIPVFDGPLKVTSNKDSGPGSLRSVVAAATPGDTIQFALSPAIHTIKLKTPISLTEPLDIEGPGAAQLTISGNGVTRIFTIDQRAVGTTIAGLTLKSGLAVEGGAILDDGASLTLSSDVFKDNQAASTDPEQPATGGAVAVLGGTADGMTVAVNNSTFDGEVAVGAVARSETGDEYAGGSGEGGAVYVLGRTSHGLAVSITGSTFTGDTATGGIGMDGAGTSRSATAGGHGEGGAVYLAGSQTDTPSFTLSNDEFTKCVATGGAGGNGSAGVDGNAGAGGGNAEGGAVFYTDDSADAPALTVTSCTFSSSSVVAGAGGSGGNGTGSPSALVTGGTGGAGAAGGLALGGAIGIEFESSTAGTVTMTGDTLNSNSAQGGNGGAGGAGSVVGGDGGAGGEVHGGAIEVFVDGVASSTNLTIAGSGISGTTAQGGNGGTGGPSKKQGGRGGDGARPFGGAIDLRSGLGISPDTWTLDSDSVNLTTATSGAGGAGGAGHTGGDGGDSLGTFGGGLCDLFEGTLDLLHCDITSNVAHGGIAGTGGLGALSGNVGQVTLSLGGGAYVSGLSNAEATPDTQIIGNSAGFQDDVYGNIGTL